MDVVLSVYLPVEVNGDLLRPSVTLQSPFFLHFYKPNQLQFGIVGPSVEVVITLLISELKVDKREESVPVT